MTDLLKRVHTLLSGMESVTDVGGHPEMITVLVRAMGQFRANDICITVDVVDDRVDIGAALLSTEHLEEGMLEHLLGKVASMQADLDGARILSSGGYLAANISLLVQKPEELQSDFQSLFFQFALEVAAIREELSRTAQEYVQNHHSQGETASPLKPDRDTVPGVTEAQEQSSEYCWEPHQLN